MKLHPLGPLPEELCYLFDTIIITPKEGGSTASEGDTTQPSSFVQGWLTSVPGAPHSCPLPQSKLISTDELGSVTDSSDRKPTALCRRAQVESISNGSIYL